MVNRISPLKFNKSSASRLALGAASIMMLTVVSSAGMVGATPVTTGTANAKNTTSLNQEQDKTKAKDQDRQKAEQDQKNQKDQKDRQDQKDHENNNHKEQDKEHGHDGGGKGYAGSNGNAIHTNITNTQTGNNNVFSVIINYIFG